MKNYAKGMLAMMLVTSSMAVPTMAVEATSAVQVKSMTQQADAVQNIALDKKWTIRFNQPIAKNVDLRANFHVVDEHGEEMQLLLDISTDRKTVTATPANRYKREMLYTLTVDEGLEAENGKKLKQTVTKKFKTETRDAVSSYEYAKSYIIENTSDTEQTITWKDTADAIVFNSSGDVFTNFSSVKNGYKLAAGKKMHISLHTSKEAPIASDVVMNETTEGVYQTITIAKYGAVRITNDKSQTAKINIIEGTQVANPEMTIYSSSTGKAMSVQRQIAYGFYADKGTTNILSNEYDAPFKLKVPSYTGVKFEEVDEMALKNYYVEPNETVQVTSKIRVNPVITMPIRIMNDHNEEVQYDILSYTGANIAMIMKEEKVTKAASDNEEYIYYDGDTVIHNKQGTKRLRLSAPTRNVVYQPTSEKAITAYDIAPNETVRMTSTQPSSLITGTALEVKNTTNAVQTYDAVEYVNDWFSFNSGHYKVSPNVVGHVNVTQGDNSETILQNTSNAPLHIMAPGRFVKYETHQATVFSTKTLKKGESTTITSSAKSYHGMKNDEFIVTGDVGASYRAKTQQLAGNDEELVHTYSKATDFKERVWYQKKTVITNTSDLPITVAVNKYMNFE